jgi:hypothetical protein
VKFPAELRVRNHCQIAIHGTTAQAEQLRAMFDADAVRVSQNRYPYYPYRQSKLCFKRRQTEPLDMNSGLASFDMKARKTTAYSMEGIVLPLFEQRIAGMKIAMAVRA